MTKHHLLAAAAVLVAGTIGLGAFAAGPRAGAPMAGAPQQEMGTVFVVRHAEKAAQGRDPELIEEGNVRAAALAEALRDAGVEAIFVTQFQRTRQTAAPIAAALSCEPVVIAATADAAAHAKDVAGRIRGHFALAAVDTAPGRVLVVGHSNTVPMIMKELGVAAPAELAESDYDNLFIVTLRKDGPPLVVRAKYGR